MDIELPGRDGLSLTSDLRGHRATRDLLIVACTGNVMPEDEAKALAAGCDAYVTKPIDTIALPARLAELLAQRGKPTPA